MTYPHILEIHKKVAEINAGRKPQFGDRMRNLVAGENNPRRDAYFVKEKRVESRLNHGLWYTMTDRKGNFWDSCPEGLIFIDE